ncbi:hypothetical protein CH54_1417 [Yersinia rochesterensis]|uniref:Uncharacterized protein n=1 Tax=Yersinia rochesterensis TaxID=1604335 RepID=A0ABM5SPP6_9GAMM|nr:hypothetical protein [Yersinia rochesterensis]AIN19225.1 hypothetical protein DJ57_2264 [Yersinia rochesterensis]AJI86388.1 hypothetical protein AW19_247 [Yersinia frederiksenii Y225]AJJ36492.1 hypothetical protein CH54_1417 [Yersinia rochesterensis]
MSDFISTMSFLAACIGALYAFKAYQSSREISFPKNRAHTTHIEIGHLSKEAKSFHDFISDNVDRLVYLNIRFDDNNFKFDDGVIDDKKYKHLTIWLEKIDPNSREVVGPLSVMNASGLNLSIIINDNSDAKVGYHRGYNMLHGYFYITAYGGPHQGYMGATLRSAVMG